MHDSYREFSPEQGFSFAGKRAEKHVRHTVIGSFNGGTVGLDTGIACLLAMLKRRTNN